MTGRVRALFRVYESQRVMYRPGRMPPIVGAGHSGMGAIVPFHFDMHIAWVGGTA